MAAILDKLPDVHVGRLDVTSVVRETVREVSDDDVPGLAAEMAYHSILALFPFLLFLAGLTAVINRFFDVGNLTDRIVDRASDILPEDATSLFRSFLDQIVKSRGEGALIIGLLASLWAASAAIGCVMKALNRAYDVQENRGFFARKAVAIVLTVLFGGLILTASVLIGTGQFMAGGIGRAFGWHSQFVTLWNWLTFPLALVLVTFAVSLLYWLAPATRHSYRWITPGALLFVVGWVVASVGFAIYISNFGSYNRSYGSTAAVIVLLVWLYWSSLLLLIGGELNAVLARREDPDYRAEQGVKPQTASGSRAQP